MTVAANKNTYNTTIVDIVGLSTEIKPIIYYEGYLISSGSTYKESDTNDMYMYYKENRQWYLLQE
jgi:hypothetical protein